MLTCADPVLHTWRLLQVPLKKQSAVAVKDWVPRRSWDCFLAISPG